MTVPDRQDSHGDWEIELYAAVLLAIIIAALVALFVSLFA